MTKFREKLNEALNHNIIMYHGTLLSPEFILKNGLDPSFSKSPLKGIYLSSEQYLALGTADGRAELQYDKITLVSILIDQNIELHPDDDIFDHGYEEDIDLRMFKNPEDFNFEDDSIEQSKKLLIDITKLGQGMYGNCIFFDKIGFSGIPRIINVEQKNELH